MSIFPPGPPNINTYMASTAFFTGAASATDIFQIYGSGSKTVKVLKVLVATIAVGGSSTPSRYYLLKRSTANSGGTAVTLTNVPVDSNNAAATAVVKNYTANPTLGSSVGQVSAAVLAMPDPTAGSNTRYAPVTIFDADKYGQPITLRGTSEGLVVNCNGVTIGGLTPTIAITVVWTEE